MKYLPATNRNVYKTHVLALCAVLGLCGCAGSGGSVDGGGGGGGGVATPNLEAKKVGSEAEALSYLSTGDYYQTDLSSDFPNGSKGQAYAGEFNMTGSAGGINAQVTIVAAYTSTDLYLQLQWSDPTSSLNIDRRRFLFNGPGEGGNGTVNGWSSQLNDDKFALAFDIAAATDSTGTFASKGCTVGCHGSMNPEAGIMDIWHWKTSRSNPMGYVNDQWADSAGRKNDAGDPIEVRNWKVSNNIAAGPGKYWPPESGSQVVTLPNAAEGTVTLDPNRFLLKAHATPLVGAADTGEVLFNSKCGTCHSPIANWSGKFASRGLANTDAQLQAYLSGGSHPGAGSTTGFTTDDWNNIFARIRAFQGVPGYFLQPPTGSNADLVVMNSKTVYENGKYTVRVRRKLVTGNSDDVQFDLAKAKEYAFGVAIMDNDGKNHAGKAHQILKFLD